MNLRTVAFLFAASVPGMEAVANPLAPTYPKPRREEPMPEMSTKEKHARNRAASKRKGKR